MQPVVASPHVLQIEGGGHRHESLAPCLQGEAGAVVPVAGAISLAHTECTGPYVDIAVESDREDHRRCGTKHVDRTRARWASLLTRIVLRDEIEPIAVTEPVAHRC